MKRKSANPYPIDWPVIAQEVKRRAGWRCVRCGADHDPSAGYSLTVHHLDIDPANNAWWNLTALCQRCHLHIQGKVIIERPFMFDHSDWFKPYVAGYYAHCHNHPDDIEWVTQHLDALLEYGQIPFTSSLDKLVCAQTPQEKSDP